MTTITKYLLFLFIYIAKTALNYDTFAYSPSQTLYVSAFFISEDLQNFIISDSSVSANGLLFYTAN
jgi:hypothetical protein